MFLIRVMTVFNNTNYKCVIILFIIYVFNKSNDCFLIIQTKNVLLFCLSYLFLTKVLTVFNNPNYECIIILFIMYVFNKSNACFFNNIH